SPVARAARRLPEPKSGRLKTFVSSNPSSATLTRSRRHVEFPQEMVRHPPIPPHRRKTLFSRWGPSSSAYRSTSGTRPRQRRDERTPPQYRRWFRRSVTGPADVRSAHLGWRNSPVLAAPTAPSAAEPSAHKQCSRDKGYGVHGSDCEQSRRRRRPPRLRDVGGRRRWQPLRSARRQVWSARKSAAKGLRPPYPGQPCLRSPAESALPHRYRAKPPLHRSIRN